MPHIDFDNVEDTKALSHLCGYAATRRAEFYMKRYKMSERDACRAAIAWWKNMKRQRRMRYAHGTGAYDHVQEDHRHIR